MKSITITSRRERRDAMRAASKVLDERLAAVHLLLAKTKKTKEDWQAIDRMLEGAEDQSLYMVSLAMGDEIEE